MGQQQSMAFKIRKELDILDSLHHLQHGVNFLSFHRSGLPFDARPTAKSWPVGTSKLVQWFNRWVDQLFLTILRFVFALGFDDLAWFNKSIGYLLYVQSPFQSFTSITVLITSVLELALLLCNMFQLIRGQAAKLQLFVILLVRGSITVWKNVWHLGQFPDISTKFRICAPSSSVPNRSTLNVHWICSKQEFVYLLYVNVCIAYVMNGSFASGTIQYVHW